MLGKEMSAEKIGNVPYRQGIFSAWNDPAKFGLFYHAALMTRRGDVAPAKKVYTLSPAGKVTWELDDAFPLLEQSGLVMDYDFNKEADVDWTEAAAKIKEAGEVLSDTGELYRNWKKNYGYIDTPMTKCAYGFLAKNGAQELTGVTIDCATDFGVVAMSSLTDQEICASDNILLTTVGRAVNTDSRFEGELMLDIGKPPVLIENIQATITIDTKVNGLKVWAISAEGYYIGTVPTVYENGKLTLKVGEVSQSMYYLIVKD